VRGHFQDGGLVFLRELEAAKIESLYMRRRMVVINAPRVAVTANQHLGATGRELFFA
jgi:hypothetical protein